MPKKMKHILIVLILTLIFAIGLFSFGVAYAGGVRGIGLLGVWFFITFGIVVILAQLIPAGILFSSLFKIGISSLRKGEMPIRAT